MTLKTDFQTNQCRRYGKGDIGLGSGQKKIKDSQNAANRNAPGYPAAMLKVFRDIKAQFRPVLRHYFFERALVPSSWFEMRLNYSRSVAVSSIVGHLVGLGDRHISNILIDQISGELVHIDLGIAFDQVGLIPLDFCVAV